MLVPIVFALTTQIRALPRYEYKEPNPGYLQEFKWIDKPGVVSKTRSRDTSISDVVASVMKSNNVPGAAVVVIENNQIIYEAGFGVSNVATRRPFTANTPTRCGSISKTATALTTLRATELGGFKLNDKVTNLITFPGGMKKFENKNYSGWNSLTVRDLLDHRSGIAGSMPYLPTAQMKKDWEVTGPFTRGKLIWGLLKSKAIKVSGSPYEYHNLNFEIVSEVLEQTTNKDFGDVINILLCKPLGIPSNELFLSPTYTASTVPKELPNNEARCYQFRSDFQNDFELTDAKYPEAYGGLDGQVLSGAGHIAFSAHSIAQLVIALRTQPKSFMSQKSWDEITTKPDGADDDGYYSKGTKINKVGGVFCYNHGAMLMHAGGQYNWYNKDIQFVVLANSNTKNGQLVDVILANAVRAGLKKMGK